MSWRVEEVGSPKLLLNRWAPRQTGYASSRAPRNSSARETDVRPPVWKINPIFHSTSNKNRRPRKRHRAGSFSHPPGKSAEKRGKPRMNTRGSEIKKTIAVTDNRSNRITSNKVIIGQERQDRSGPLEAVPLARNNSPRDPPRTESASNSTIHDPRRKNAQKCRRSPIPGPNSRDPVSKGFP